MKKSTTKGRETSSKLTRDVKPPTEETMVQEHRGEWNLKRRNIIPCFHYWKRKAFNLVPLQIWNRKEIGNWFVVDLLRFYDAKMLIKIYHQYNGARTLWVLLLGVWLRIGGGLFICPPYQWEFDYLSFYLIFIWCG